MALVADRLIQRFNQSYDEEPAVEDEERRSKRLPWQTKPWSDHLRRAVVVFLPILAAVAGARFDPIQAAAVTLFLAALLICTATDLLSYRVPNAITYPGTVLAILAALVMPDAAVVDAGIAALAGGGIFLFMTFATRGGLGLGDVKLAVLIGAALGPQAGYEAMVLGVIAGGVIILGLFVSGLVGRRQAIPYAPFLSLAAVAVVLVEGAAVAPL